MMKNKVIIKAIFPSIDKEYDMKIPVNEVIWKVKKLVAKAIFDISGMPIDLKNDSFIMINKSTGELYNNNSIVIDTDIKNGTEIVFLKELI